MSEQKTSGSPPQAINKDLRGARDMLEKEYNLKKTSWDRYFKVNWTTTPTIYSCNCTKKNCKVRIAVRENVLCGDCLTVRMSTGTYDGFFIWSPC